MTGVIVIPQRSGVSERDANLMLLHAIEDRAREMAKEIGFSASGLSALASRFGQLHEMDEAAAAREFVNMDAQIARLMELRTSLQYRVEAYHVQERAVEQPVDDPFADHIQTKVA
ncbi:MAG: hypothetical protein HEQ38_17155 [Gemmatimonas sp.]|nr:hypothetical protein [Gemmatimonas sp.]